MKAAVIQILYQSHWNKNAGGKEMESHKIPHVCDTLVQSRSWNVSYNRLLALKANISDEKSEVVYVCL